MAIAFRDTNGAWNSVDTISGIINPRLFSVDKYVFLFFFFLLKCYLS